MVTPTVDQAIAACKDIETNPGPYGPHVVRVLRNTRLHLQKTVRRQDVIDYYADSVILKFGHCPPVVIAALENLGEDETGIYSLAGEFIDAGRDYMTMDRVKDTIRAHINAHIADLSKIAAV